MENCNAVYMVDGKPQECGGVLEARHAVYRVLGLPFEGDYYKIGNPPLPGTREMLAIWVCNKCFTVKLMK